jgi:hypothetical protein
MLRSHFLVAAAIVAVVGGCSSSVSPGHSLALTRLRSDPRAFEVNSGYDQQTTLVIRDQAAWASAWAQIYRYISPVPPLPVVDFSTTMVVGFTPGTQADTNVEITGASQSDDIVTIAVTVSTPGPNCVVAGIISAPIDLGLLPLQSGTVSVHVTRIIVSC